MSELGSRNRLFAAHIKVLASITKLGFKEDEDAGDDAELQVKKTKTH